MLNISELKGYVLKERKQIEELHGEWDMCWSINVPVPECCSSTMTTPTRCSALRSGRRRRTIPAWRTFWSTRCSAVPRSFRPRTRSWSWPKGRSTHF